ncbi:MAG: FkbM family methyltransferase [Actinocatenispora sp.]
MAARLTEVGDGVSLYATSAPDARFLYREIFEWGSYRSARLPSDPLVVDAGANVGVFTLFVKRMRPDAEIVAFEPVEDLAAALRANVAHFGLSGVTVHTTGLGGEFRRAVPFRHYPLRPSGSSLFREDQDALKKLSARWMPSRLNERMYRGREITVDIAPLSSFLPPDRAVDLLKVDVVGAELDVFAGIDDDQWPRIRQVVVDVQDVAGRATRVREILEAHGMSTGVGRNDAAAEDGVNVLVHGQRPDIGQVPLLA